MITTRAPDGANKHVIHERQSQGIVKLVLELYTQCHCLKVKNRNRNRQGQVDSYIYEIACKTASAPHKDTASASLSKEEVEADQKIFY